jgi:hypothetical protein
MTSKLQIRAKILELIKALDLNALNKKEQEDIFLQLKNFDDKEFLQQILVKELNCEDDVLIEKIAYLIVELANPETVKTALWDYIKDSNISDSVKEISCTLLRILGEKIRPEDLVPYLDNPMELIDAETKKLLDVALSNPEVQIDFLDFLFALPKGERISLVKSLEQDYDGDRLANILVPILDSFDDNDVREFIIRALGNSKSYRAIDALENVVDYYSDNGLKKLAEIGLKKLKLSGLYYKKEEVHAIDSLACEKSVPYKCYISMPDGMGNQGLVISRLSEDENFQMFTVVLNDTEGIVDCFGFYLLTKLEFERIIDSYDKDSSNISIPPSFAKACLLKAERLSRLKQVPLPYEYLAWKTLIYDMYTSDFDLKEKAQEYAKSLKKVDYSLLVDCEIFSTWFFDRENNAVVDKFFDDLLVEHFNVDDSLNSQVEELVEKIFDKETIALYQQRLLNMTYLLDLSEDVLLRDNVALIALGLDEIQSPLECELFVWIVRKSVYELFLRERASYDDAIMFEANIFARSTQKYKSVFPQDRLTSIINELRDSWVK